MLALKFYLLKTINNLSAYLIPLLGLYLLPLLLIILQEIVSSSYQQGQELRFLLRFCRGGKYEARCLPEE